MMRIRLALWLSLCFLFSVTFAAAAQSSTPAELIFISEPQVNDRRVSVDLIVRGENGITTTPLTTPNFAVSEPSRDLTVTSEARLPLVLDVIVDLSLGSDIDLIQDTLRAYFNTYYREGDQVTFYVLGTAESRREAEVIIPENREAILDLIDSFTMADRFYTITSAVESSRDSMRALGDSPTVPRAVLFVGSLLNELGEVDVTRVFAREGIPFHIVQAHRNRQPSTQFYRAMATNGGGLFSNNLDGSFVFREGGRETAVNTLKVLYDTIANSRLVYTLSYQTQSASLDNVREVTVTAQISDETAVSGTFSYTSEFLPPRVVLVSDAVLNTVRRTYRDADLNPTFDTPEQAVEVRVEFPDGVSRRIESLKLRVIDVRTGSTLQESQLDIAPEPRASGDTYSLIWTLNGYNVPDTITDVRLEVEVVDELGLSSTLERSGTVRVEAAPPLPTATPLPPTQTPLPATEAPTLAPTLASTVPVTEDTTTAATATFDSTDALTLVQIPLVQVMLVLISVLALIALYFILKTRRYRRGMVGIDGTGDGLTDGGYTTDAGFNPSSAQGRSNGASGVPVDGVMEPEEERLLGRLIVKAGLEDREILIKKNEFTIGRLAAEDIDYIIDQPFISPRHCRLMVSDSGVFSVRDLGTKNGTFVNGERIESDHDILVPVGSEVGITKNIVVEFWDPDTEFEFVEEVDPVTGLSTRYPSRPGERDVPFPALPGMQYAPDEEGDVEDDYSPI